VAAHLRNGGTNGRACVPWRDLTIEILALTYLFDVTYSDVPIQNRRQRLGRKTVKIVNSMTK
jgi:hypothetical protein